MRAAAVFALACSLCLLVSACGTDEAEPTTSWEQDAAEKDKAEKASQLREYMEEHKGKASDAAQEQEDRAEADRKAIEEAGG